MPLLSFLQRFVSASLRRDAAASTLTLPAFVAREEETRSSPEQGGGHLRRASAARCDARASATNGMQPASGTQHSLDVFATRASCPAGLSNNEHTCVHQPMQHWPAQATDSAGDIAYLAQHSIFEQLPGLADDIRDLDVWPDGYERRNIWLGTRGTITPLHFDSLDNLFCQVAGARRFEQSWMPHRSACARQWQCQRTCWESTTGLPPFST